MRILRLAPYIVHSKLQEHAKNSTGFGRSVWDISRFSARLSENEEYLFTFHNRKPLSTDDVNFLAGGVTEYLKHLSFNSFAHAINILGKLIFMKNFELRTKFSISVHALLLDTILHHIDETKPDIIHIHGLTFGTDVFLQAAIQSKTPFVVTLHGLNMNVHPCDEWRSYEVKKIQELNEKGIYISVISSGIREEIKRICHLKYPDKIIVINHGIDPSAFCLTMKKAEIKKTMQLVGKKVIISVGSLSFRKNHRSLIRALTLLPKDVLQNIKVFIIGEGPLREQLETEIQYFSLQNIVKLTGRKEGNELAEYYTIADLNVLLSHNEGFGRPILESFLFGVPSLVFRDFDATNDLYKENCLFTIEKRDPLVVAKKIKETLNTEINPVEIKAHSRKFTWVNSSLKYLELYRHVIACHRIYEKNLF